jgi:hypothetical protein
MAVAGASVVTQPPLPAQVLEQEALAQEPGRVVRDPPQLGLQRLDPLALLWGQTRIRCG